VQHAHRTDVQQVQPPRSERFPRDDEPKRSEADLPSRLAELERELAAVGMFASVAAHELMEPLVMAETHGRMIAEQLEVRTAVETRSDLDSLLRAITRMRLLVETLLLEARSHGQPLQRAPVSVQRLVEASIELLDSEIHARGARIAAADLPVIHGDGTMLGRVVTNLLMNALRYGPRGESEVRIEARRERTHWRISVTSRGATIPKEDRERIFEPYRRGTHERRVAGAGLGLTVCRTFIERHDGEIGVIPARGGGNCFYFTIPALERPNPRPSSTPRS
jgi:signal transduction histidine kinase